MKIIIVGASGTIGKAVVSALKMNHEVIRASRSGDLPVDLTNSDSIRAMFANVSGVDGVISVAGEAKFGPLDTLSDADFDLGLQSKLMGQVNLVRLGLEHVNPGGIFVLTTGILAHNPNPASVMLTMINRGLEGFVEAAALNFKGGTRINAVCPPLAKETAEKMGWGPGGVAAAEIAKYYVRAVESNLSGISLGPTHSS
jgi:NAD(P)-dependent dehydrogenase (short-subunit alcohol dehydrogenase family)